MASSSNHQLVPLLKIPFDIIQSKVSITKSWAEGSKICKGCYGKYGSERKSQSKTCWLKLAGGKCSGKLLHVSHDQANLTRIVPVGRKICKMHRDALNQGETNVQIISTPPLQVMSSVSIPPDELRQLRGKIAAVEMHRAKIVKKANREKSILKAQAGREKKRRLSLEQELDKMEQEMLSMEEDIAMTEERLKEAMRNAETAVDDARLEADAKVKCIETELKAAKKRVSSLQNKINASRPRRRSSYDPYYTAKLIGDQLLQSQNDMDDEEFSDFIDNVLGVIVKRFDALKFLHAEQILREVGANVIDILKCARVRPNVSRSKIAAQMHQSVVAAAVPSGKSKNVDGWLVTLGINRHTFYTAKERRNNFIVGNVDHLHKGKRKTRKDKLELRYPGLRKAVEKYFDTATEYIKPSPDASQVLKLHVNTRGTPIRHHRDSKKPCNPGCKSKHRIDVTVNRRTLYEDFLGKIGDFLPDFIAMQLNEKTFSYNRFIEMIPWNVRRRNKRTCVCIYHLHMLLLLASYRQKALKIHKNCDCQCPFCVGGGCSDHVPTRSLDEFASHIHKTCIDSLEIQHFRFEHLQPNCATGNCETCKADKCPAWICPRELKHDGDITPFKEMAKEKRMITTKSGMKEGTYTIERRVTNKTLKYLKARIVKTYHSKEKFTGFEQAVGFSEHRWVARVQNKGYDEMISSKLPRNHIVLTIDFGSNASFLADDQTQGEFFQPVQATVLPIIVHYWKRVPQDSRGIDQSRSPRSIWMLCASAYDVISDDLSHDNAFVQAILRDVVAEFKGKLEMESQELEFVHIWSDGCRSQFKGRQQFAFISCSESILGVKMEHNFFCSCHGKGGSDAETAFIHASFGKFQKVERINSAKDGFNRLQTRNLAPKGASKRLEGYSEKKHQLVERMIVFVDAKDVNKKDAIKPGEGPAGGLKGSNNHHAFAAAGGDGNILMRWVSCLRACDRCLVLDYGNCEESHVNNFCTNRVPGSLKPLAKTMTVRNPVAERKARVIRDESAAGEPPNPRDVQVNPRGHRVHRRWQRHMRKGFTFCVRANMNDPDGDPGGILYCVATEYERSLFQVFYNIYNPLPEEPGVFKLNEEDTFMCSLGELLPPFGYRLARVDNKARTFSIPPHVQDEFTATVASLREDPAADVDL